MLPSSIIDYGYLPTASASEFCTLPVQHDVGALASMILLAIGHCINRTQHSPLTLNGLKPSGSVRLGIDMFLMFGILG